jgi:hypothetical protein
MKIHDNKILRAHLSQNNAALYARFKSFELQAEKILEWAQAGAHLSHTTHGLSHIHRVEEIYDWLLGGDDINDLTSGEVFCLLCATYCHDMFMIPKFAGDEPRARAEHASRAATELRKLQGQLGLTTSEATYIGEIIRGHHVEQISELMADAVLGSDNIRIQMLGSCLSMADICHADESRAPKIVFEYLSLEEDSAWHWRRHMQISGINRSGNKILLSAISFSDEGRHAVEQYALEIERQLKRVSPYFDVKLLPLTSVDLRIRELESEFDQDLSFKTDTAAVLDMLVSGIYQQPDVFVRELIQNALDATYVETARCKKNAIPYQPTIAITALRNGSGKTLAVRIDDNGSGMDVSEVKDTLLLIGQSRNNKESVQNLLKETGKSLIANFGIGLLSCFRVAANTVIRTQKGESGRSFEVAIAGYGERINLEAAEVDIGGTTVFVWLKDEFSSLDIDDVVRHYCRMVSLAKIYLFSSRDEGEFESSRKSLFSAVEAGGALLEQTSLGEGAVGIQGNGYYCRIAVPWNADIRQVVSEQGSLDILNDGIFVCEDRTRDWLPETLAYCSGFINFAAKEVDLPVARDAIVNNAKLDSKVADLRDRSYLFFEKIAAESQKKQFRDQVAIIFAYGFLKTAKDKQSMFLRQVGQLNIQLFDGSTTTLANIAKSESSSVYVVYKEGSFVTELSKFDSLTLWYKKDEIAMMRAELAHRSGSVVIVGVRADMISGTYDKVREWDVIAPYLQAHGMSVVDLLESQIIVGDLRSLGLPRELRTMVGKRVKFVETGIVPGKIGWDLGDEVWFNVTNPTVRKMYERIRTSELSDREHLALSVLVSLVDNEFDLAVEQCVSVITG